ncbi:MAG: type ISP restriction/modification enzyme [Thermoguttaceae bacterium]
MDHFHLSVVDIPLETDGYVVNGEPEIEWVMKRYAVTTDRANGTINDSNLFDGPNPKHIVELTGQVVTVSFSTTRLVKNLPQLCMLEERNGLLIVMESTPDKGEESLPLVFLEYFPAKNSFRIRFPSLRQRRGRKRTSCRLTNHTSRARYTTRSVASPFGQDSKGP